MNIQYKQPLDFIYIYIYMFFFCCCCCCCCFLFLFFYMQYEILLINTVDLLKVFFCLFVYLLFMYLFVCCFVLHHVNMNKQYRQLPDFLK